VALARLEDPRLDPVGHPLGRVLLEEEAGRDALAEALHRERAVAQVRHEGVGDVPVVLEQLGLRDAALREEHPVAAREPDLAVRPAHGIGAGCGNDEPTSTGAPSLASEARIASMMSITCAAW